MVFAASLSRVFLLVVIATVVSASGEAVPPPLKDTPPFPDLSTAGVEVIKRFMMKNPEDVAVDPTETYFITGTRDGYVSKVDIESGFYELIFGPRDFRPDLFLNSTDEEIRSFCNGQHSVREAECGGVLGIKFEYDSTTGDCKSIWIANAYFGIYEGSCSEPWTLEQRVAIEGGFVNNVQPLGKYMYYTVSHSTKQRNQLAFVVLDDKAPGGSLHRIDTSNNYTTEELANDLYFANGLAVSTDGSSIYVSETSAARIRKYDIESGLLEPFLDDIPVLTDNILVQDGEILVPGYTRNYTMEELMTNFTLLETFLEQDPAVVAAEFAAMIAPHGNLLIYDEATGNLKERIFQAERGKFTSASSAHKLGDGYLVGSSFFPGATWFQVTPTSTSDTTTSSSSEDAETSTEDETEDKTIFSSAVENKNFQIMVCMFLSAVGATAMLLIV